ncbi:hypothetical protein ACFX58_03530 [Sphingomonas sp. NCPPB 2930]
MKSYAAAVAATLVLALMAFGLGALVYNAGRTKERVIWVEKEKQAAQTFARQLDSEVKRGAAADKKYQADLAQLNTRYSTLEGKYEDLRGRVPLVVYRPAVAAKSAPPGAAAAAPGATQPAQGSVGRPAGYGISNGALWMWNSSLAGTDIPAGACGSADTTSPACAADAGVSVEEAWSNQHTNAKSCAADRLRYRALIEFLTQQPAAAKSPTP